MSQVDLLYRLQQIDDQIRDSKKRLAQVLQLSKGSSELGTAQQKAKRAEEVLGKWRGRQNALNLELKGLNDKANREEKRLYSGTVNNPKELEDIQHELEALGRRRSILEDELIEAMIQAEESEEEESEAKLELMAIEENWAREHTSLKEEQEELINTMGDLTKQREELLGLVTRESMKAYENAIRRAGTTAVVQLKGTRCLGCQVSVPANLIKLVEDGHLVACDNCSRVLCRA